MKTLFKILGGLFVLVVLIGIFAPDSKKTAATEVAAATPTAPEKPALEILSKSATSNEFASTIHVKVRNNTDHLVQYLDLKSVYYDKKGTIVGTGLGNAANLAAGATKTIDVMATGIEHATKYEVEIGNVMD